MLPGESLRRISAADKRAEEALVAGLPVSGNCNSSALHLLARLQRTRSLRRSPYVDLGIKTLMKANFQRVFLTESPQG